MYLLRQIGFATLIGVLLVSSSWSKKPATDKLDCRLKSLIGETQSTSVRSSMLRHETWFSGKQVKVEIRLNVLAEKVIDRLEAVGLKVSAHYAGLVSGTISRDRLRDLASLDFVSTVYPAFKPYRITPDRFVSNQKRDLYDDEMETSFPYQGEGVASLHADIVQDNNPSFDGSGVKVGIISDSFGLVSESTPVYADIDEDGIDDIVGTDSQLLGELPITVGILEEAIPEYDEEGNPWNADEGRAMAEIVHEMAPGAKLYFHAAFNNGRAGTAAAIEKLAAAGCTVITDDTFYLDEPMFQDGEIAQAIDRVSTASDVIFITAAGNQDVNTIYTQYYDIDPENNNEEWSKIPNEADFHNWDRVFGPSQYFPVTVLPGIEVRATLHWENPFSGLLGEGASTDYDVYVFDSDFNLISVADNNQGTPESPSGDPWEIFDFGPFFDDAETPQVIYIAVDKHHGPAVPFKMVFFAANEYIKLTGNRFDHSIQFGRNQSKQAVSVAAVNVFENSSGGELLDDPHVIDPTFYSSKGGTIRILFSPEGEKLSEPEFRFSPHVSSVDGANNSFFGGYGDDGDDLPNFWGTSAASPHLAGIVAMMRQAAPGLISSEIRQLLMDSAIDIFDPGVDSFTGHGMVYADVAVQAALNKQAEIDPSQPPITINTPTPAPPTPTPTVTPAATATPLVPLDSVIVTDNLDTYQDLSGGLDIDPADQRELVIRVNMDLTDIVDIHIYISVDGEESVYLGRIATIEDQYFVWKESQSVTIAKPFQDGPQGNHTYTFSVYLLTESKNPPHYGPFETGPVDYYVGDSE